MDKLDLSVLSLVREFGNLIHPVLENTPQRSSCQHNQNEKDSISSELDKSLFENLVIGATNLLVPDMTFSELKQSIAQFTPEKLFPNP